MRSIGVRYVGLGKTCNPLTLTYYCMRSIGVRYVGLEKHVIL